MQKSFNFAQIALGAAVCLCVFANLPASLAVEGAKQGATSSKTSADAVCDGPGPCIIDPATGKPVKTNPIFKVDNSKIRNIDIKKEPWLIESANLPVNHPATNRAKIIFADSIMYVPINEIVPAVPIEKWLNPIPENIAGKYVLIEFWATWCPPCRRSLSLLNYLSEKYKDDLVVVSICEMEEEAIRNIPGELKLKDMKFPIAVDTGRRLATKLNVWGIPHAILLEPNYGAVIWEGMPTLPNHELSPDVLEKIFKVGRKLRADGKLPEISPVKFVVKQATELEREKNRKKKHCSYNNQDVEGENGGPSIADKPTK